VFLDEVPGFSPKRDIIDLVLGVALVSKIPYIMSTLEGLEM